MVFSLSNFFELLFWVILLFKVLFWVNVLFWGIFWVNLLVWALFWVTLFDLDALLGTFTFLSTFKSPFFCHLLFWALLKVLFFYFFRLKTFMLPVWKQNCNVVPTTHTQISTPSHPPFSTLAHYPPLSTLAFTLNSLSLLPLSILKQKENNQQQWEKWLTDHIQVVLTFLIFSICHCSMFSAATNMSLH